MNYQHVCLEAISYSLPEEIVTSEELEARLADVYQRLRLPAGRLELMTGIRERRFWPKGTLPGDVSVTTGEKAIRSSGIDRDEIGLLVHGSVCRDHLEPATASSVHHRLGLSDRCLVYDVSNACLGLLNGMLQAANMIELGHTRAALVVGTEDARHLVEATIDSLNADQTLTRESVKPAVASLTIGSGSAAVLLTHRDLSRTGNRLIGAAWRAETAHHRLCHSGADEAAGGGMRPLMETDSETLMREGVAAAQATFASFQSQTGWSTANIDKTVCHQVGLAHRKLLLSALGLDPRNDFTTVETLGNTGSVALPMTAAIAAERGHLNPNDRLALLGIGSGINVVMLGVEWQTAAIAQASDAAATMALSAP